MLSDLSLAFETVKKMTENTEAVKQAGEVKNLEFVDTEIGGREIPNTESGQGLELQDQSRLMEEQNREVKEAAYMSDDIGLREQTQEFGDPAYIRELRESYPNMDTVLSKNEEILRDPGSDLAYQRAADTLERYKGTVFENEIKDSLGDRFELTESKQMTVETEYGETKPDVVLRGALEEMRIGDLTVGKGEDLYIEAKCGSAEYIRNQMGHMLEQVEGHEQNSLVVVTRDYLDIAPDVRAEFEKQLSEKGSHLYVADVRAMDISNGLFSSLKL
ncbi:hypothetical protein D3P08_06150 [Paenibacillus nanensis]|uniref:Uncharacterized protein n=1 Tax=Paenibacillus nanensis TaxID=393251 RepID=A0A3A1VHG6_9BACL|nr:hypothetical protein [Paenibacillus nanensis]RIX59705.1 hypothetical protein D3P08_06150 [Paenibacillus nanensis]